MCQAYEYQRKYCPKLEGEIEPPKEEVDPHKVIESKLERFRQKMNALREKEKKEAEEKEIFKSEEESENSS